jgi:hypothetical protein
MAYQSTQHPEVQKLAHQSAATLVGRLIRGLWVRRIPFFLGRVLVLLPKAKDTYQQVYI